MGGSCYTFKALVCSVKFKCPHEINGTYMLSVSGNGNNPQQRAEM